MDTRRDFLKKSAALTAYGLLHSWASAIPASDRLGKVLPMRRIIRNGEKTTTFCLGGWHLGEGEPGLAEQMVERALELGVRFFDTARGYQRGGSEEYLGRFLTPKYREDVFLMTKSFSRTGEKARKDLEASLSALKTDHLDLWQMHTVFTKEDVDQRLNDGVLDVFLEAKAKGKTRYIGYTGHASPHVNLYMLEELKKRGLELDTCQMPLNVCDPSFESFQNVVLPLLLEREYGVIAMKTMAGGSMMGKRIDTTPKEIATEDIPNMVGDTGITFAELHQYVYTLPVSSLVSGCLTLEELEHNVGVLQQLKKLSEDDMDRLVKMAKPYAGLIVENYKRLLG
jgi:aryl-alcohol dehydrogenase-like predicted oxidoreductase